MSSRPDAEHAAPDPGADKTGTRRRVRVRRRPGPGEARPPGKRPKAPVLRSSSVHTEIAERRSAEARATATATEAARELPRGVVRRLFRLVADIWRKSDRDRLLGLAAENAFAALLCVFPVLIVVAAVLGQLSVVIGPGNAEQVEQEVLDFLRDLLSNEDSPAIRTAQDLFDSTGRALTFALLLGFASVAQAFASVINTVTLTYDVADTRGWWHRRGLGLVLGLLSILMAVLVITLVVVGPLFAASDVVTSLGLSDQYAFVFAYLRWPVALLALLGWATTMYHWAPDRAGPWRNGIPGALLASVIWLGASTLFNLYLEVALDRSPVFSALGGGLILISWLYLMCLGLLIGAELNAVLLARRMTLRQTSQAPTEVLGVVPGTPAEGPSSSAARMRRRALQRAKRALDSARR